MLNTELKIFLGSLPPQLTNQELKSLLSPFGEIKTVHLLFHKKTGFCKGFGHIIVGNKATFDKILNTKNFKIKGRKIFKEPFLTGRKLSEKKQKFVNKRIYVSNLSTKITDEDMREIFSVFGDIDQAYRIVSADGVQQPFGFVLFKEEESAKRCHKQGMLECKGKKLKCRLFVNFEEQKKIVEEIR